jgi:phytoene dehydrogenase-like protein
MKYDVAIIGSGLGGLQSAYILSKEGYNVCVLEKNRVLGGCLQTFRRCGCVFDTGMHYIGGMDQDGMLRKYFSYFGLTSNLKLKRLDENGYDIIRYQGKDYPFAMGFQLFFETMLERFPQERKALESYVSLLKDVSRSVDIFSLNFEAGVQVEYLKYLELGIAPYLDSITQNETLKNVLVGMAPLYAGRKNTASLYAHMAIHSGYIHGAYRFVDGGEQMTDILADGIRSFGGTLMKNAAVTHLHMHNGRIDSVEINGGERIEADHVISAIHPKSLLQLMDPHAFRPAFRNRIFGISETYGMFSLYLSMKPDYAYINSNFYCYHTDDLWQSYEPGGEWPRGYMMHFSPLSADPEHTNAVIVNTVMHWEEMLPWIDTRVESRGDSYRAFKEEKAEKLLGLLEKDFPGFRKSVKLFYTSTPLTYRDYTGTWQGSVYGMEKGYGNPMSTMILPRTHVRNLLLTGQIVNMHGVEGVSVGSFLTCSELVGKNYLIEKLKNEI